MLGCRPIGGSPVGSTGFPWGGEGAGLQNGTPPSVRVHAGSKPPCFPFITAFSAASCVGSATCGAGLQSYTLQLLRVVVRFRLGLETLTDGL